MEGRTFWLLKLSSHWSELPQEVGSSGYQKVMHSKAELCFGRAVTAGVKALEGDLKKITVSDVFLQTLSFPRNWGKESAQKLPLLFSDHLK